MSYRRKSGLGMASLILGVLSPIGGGPFTAIPGAIIGHMARTRIRNFPERYSGDGMALMGLVLSYFVLALCVLALLVGAYWALTGELNTMLKAGSEYIEKLKTAL